MDQGHILTVVQGEASESDDEEICSITDRASDKTTTEGSVVVAGEASESDEDDVVSNIPPLRGTTPWNDDLGNPNEGAQSNLALHTRIDSTKRLLTNCEIRLSTVEYDLY